MRQKGSALIILAVLVIVATIFTVFLFKAVRFTQYSVPAVEETTNYKDLTYFTQADKEKIFSAIDASKTPSEFDWNVFVAWTDVLDAYNEVKEPEDPFLVAPEIMTDNPESILVDYGYKEVDFLSGIGITSLTEEDMPSLRSFAKIYFEELFRYPIAWGDIMTAPVVVFVKSAELEGEVVGGVETGAIVYNISGWFNEDYTRGKIHHELMHWLEQSTGSGNDTAWPKNQSEYTSDYNFGSSYNSEEHPKPGFVTGYAEVNVAEDKAETYEYLFVRQDKLMEFAKDDPILSAKVKYLKDFIKKRVDKMDDSYFENI